LPDRSGPIRRMLDRYIDEDALRFHMPGHKGLVGLPGAAYDLTEVPGTDELFHPREGIREAADAAARAWDAGGSFLLVNGSTAGIQAMALWAKAQGRRLVLPRDCHISAVYACALADIQPIWAEMEWSAHEQLFKWDARRIVERLPAERSAVFITYPDYYGRCADLSELKEALRGHDAVLLADSAHGAHFTFSGRLPPDAGEAAGIWVTGAHKTLPAPTQTAFLHVRDAADAPEVARLLRGVVSSSPSYLLMAGLDDARAYMDADAGALERLIDGCLELGGRIDRLAGLRCWCDADAARMGYARRDPTRLVVDVRGLGLSGWEAGARLRKLGLQVEMCDIRRVVLIASPMDGRDRLDAAGAIFEQLASGGRTARPARGIGAVPRPGKAAMTLREAWLSATEEAELRHAAGRIAAEPFGAYPPGIPLCMPGEIIGPGALAAIEEAQALGGSLFGMRDGKTFVVKDK
jgi:lysine decarboxylase